MITLSAPPTLAPIQSDTAPRDRRHLSAAAGFGVPLPRGLRKEAQDMSWDTFLAEYAPTGGPLRLGHWACTDAERPAARLGPQPRNYSATLAVGDRIGTSTAAACGPVAALTEMLHQLGITVETTAFHQVPAGNDVATVIHGSDGVHSEWAVGLSDDATLSALRAVIACANRLLAAA